jgi:HSP20 family protein
MRRIFRRVSGVARPGVTDLRENEAEITEEELDEAYEEETEAEEADEEEDGGEEEGDHEPEAEKEWMEDDYEEGQLAIDVYQTKNNLVVKSTIAGVKPDNIDISMNNDMLTIRGRREMEDQIEEQDYIYRECYWGAFSRSVILPVEVETSKIDAFLENGVLTVILPKAKSAKEISIKVKERKA